MKSEHLNQIKILVVGEQGDVSWKGGWATGMHVLVEEARASDQVCLGFIDLDADTYFGEKQCIRIINEELPFLRKKKKLDDNLLDKIEMGAQKVLASSWVYLKFEGEIYGINELVGTTEKK